MCVPAFIFVPRLVNPLDNDGAEDDASRDGVEEEKQLFANLYADMEDASSRISDQSSTFLEGAQFAYYDDITEPQQQESSLCRWQNATIAKTNAKSSCTAIRSKSLPPVLPTKEFQQQLPRWMVDISITENTSEDSFDLEGDTPSCLLYTSPSPRD